MEQFDIYRIEGEEEESGEEMYGEESGGEEQEFKATFEEEVGAMSAKYVAHDCPPPIPFPKDSAEFNKEMASRSPLERFQMKVNMEAIQLTESDETVITFSVEDRNNLCRYAERSSLVGTDAMYLNASAYVLGYWVTNGGRVANGEAAIDMDKWDEILKIIDVINVDGKKRVVVSKGIIDDKAGVLAPDVIRYARFVSKLVNVL